MSIAFKCDRCGDYRKGVPAAAVCITGHAENADVCNLCLTDVLRVWRTIDRATEDTKP